MERGNAALYAPGFFGVKILVCLGKKIFDPLAIPAVNRNADARRDRRLFLVLRHDDANTICDALSLHLERLRQNESELIAAVARGGIDGAAMNAQDGGEAAEGSAADEMTEAIVDFF